MRAVWIRRVACIGATFSMLGTVSAADARALELRFVHAVPGAGPARLVANGTRIGTAVSFGRATSYTRVRGGRVELRLRAADGPRTLARAQASLAAGRHTVVASRRPDGVRLAAYRDGRPRAGTARLRVIRAAGELGEAAVRLDGRTIARSLPVGEASPYRSVEPGTYELRVTRPGGGGGAIATRSGVALPAGTATTAVVLGSGGERVRVVLLSDGTAAPSRAPGTGLGGLDGGPSWAAVLAAALAAGALGGAAYTLARRRGA